MTSHGMRHAHTHMAVTAPMAGGAISLLCANMTTPWSSWSAGPCKLETASKGMELAAFCLWCVMQVTNSYDVPLTCGGLQDPTGLNHRAKGWSLLHLAASTGQPSSVAMLIKLGADVHGAYCPGLACICSNLNSYQEWKGHKFPSTAGLYSCILQTASCCLDDLACSVGWELHFPCLTCLTGTKLYFGALPLHMACIGVAASHPIGVAASQPIGVAAS